jgi:hypothetical protein
MAVPAGSAEKSDFRLRFPGSVTFLYFGQSTVLHAWKKSAFSGGQCNDENAWKFLHFFGQKIGDFSKFFVRFFFTLQVTDAYFKNVQNSANFTEIYTIDTVGMYYTGDNLRLVYMMITSH